MQRAFYERISPIQINYLGYYATTGNPNIDYWLGDHSLFPSDTCEFSTEKLLRLSRCFISWNPSKPLPEASSPIPEYMGDDAPSFGCFNHNRKFSDETLHTWANLLHNVPNSRLVLKTSNQDDPDTQGTSYKAYA